MAIFNDRMREKRLKKGLSQRMIGDVMGVTKQTVQLYEYGTHKISLDRATQIATILGVSLDWLAGLSDKEDVNK